MIDYLKSQIQSVDVAGFRRVRGSIQDPEAVDFVRRFSSLGEHGVLWFGLVGAGAVVDRRRRRNWLRAGATIAAAYATSTAVKVVVHRHRPDIDGLPPLISTPTNLSFPSSHATTSFAAASALNGLLPTLPLYTLATAMAVSRLYLGVHYPSDIIVGAALGSTVGSIARVNNGK